MSIKKLKVANTKTKYPTRAKGKVGFTLYMQDSLKEDLKKLADKDSRNMSDYVVQLIKKDRDLNLN